ncbi:acyl-CoA dehydrogenase [Allokutzneria sp. A3M-2-11 16]|uniref:acyl-CoA dehydrogenase n=1 Tax=Allokutzneria sp. A3M-2-11 16 TaxID=2962043 RepID=UPI0020B7AB7B|nr:acyl-CoA dehydrogenase [Allokutzneria sp. A3M-2-11 16]MCP3801989.1 acyl-CoA dehydrogenase [Allokutzneria sp. A3M-2-11 16]
MAVDDELVALLGNPHDPENPVGYRSCLKADERGEILREGERRLTDFGLGAEFVPADMGGRLRTLDRTVALLRAVYARDPALGLGFGLTSLIAAVNVWAAGEGALRREAADVLLGRGRIASAYHEFAHGSDIAAAELAASPECGGYVLTGHKEVVTNIGRAEAILVYARTSPAPGPRSHSLFLLRSAELPAGAVRRHHRYPSVGMRSVQLGGLDFDRCRVVADRRVGSEGAGLEIALRSFQVTRTVIPGVLTGILDTALRMALRYALDRRLYGRPVIALPRVRAVLADVYGDLLLAETFARVAVRALHLLPEQAVMHAAAVKYLVPQMIVAGVNNLAGLLGGSSYLREGEHAYFQKLVRDVQPSTFGHASGISCLMSLLTYLPAIGRTARQNRPRLPTEEMFRPTAPLPDLAWERLGLRGGDVDDLFMLPLTDVPLPERCAEVVEAIEAERTSLAERYAGLSPEDRGAAARVSAYELARRYTIVLAASSCVGVWRHRTSNDANATATAGALVRAAHLLDRNREMSTQVRENLLDEATQRIESHARLCDPG